MTKDRNRWPDVFVRDLMGGTTVRASVDTRGGDAAWSSSNPSMSGDGRLVAFDSLASDLVEGDTNGTGDVFVRDLVAGTTIRVSQDTEGQDPNGTSVGPSISSDGRYVAFESYASDLVEADGNGKPELFVRDLVAGTTVRVSVDRAGGDPEDASHDASISADGRYVAFRSSASDLVEGDGNGQPDLFVRDLVAGITVRASVDAWGGDPDSSNEPSINADGRYVAFQSNATDLIHGDRHDHGDIFVRDLLAGTTLRVSQAVDGGARTGGASPPPSLRVATSLGSSRMPETSCPGGGIQPWTCSSPAADEPKAPPCIEGRFKGGETPLAPTTW